MQPQLCNKLCFLCILRADYQVNMEDPTYINGGDKNSLSKADRAMLLTGKKTPVRV